MAAGHQLAANDLAAEKLCRPVVQYLGDFFSNTAEGLRIVSDFLRMTRWLWQAAIARPPQHSKVQAQKFEIQAFTDGCFGSGFYRCDDRFFVRSNNNLTRSKVPCEWAIRSIYAYRNLY
jgi:hypothetical protein